MTDDFSHLNEEERLKAENEFLKMKLMLEKGAQFGGTGDHELPSDIENQFLKNIMEFEKQFEERKTIKIFDKIGRPVQFKPVAEIPESEMDNAWIELREYLSQSGIDLSVCSPNISNRELYRFATEELFDHETVDMNIPGMMTGFIYDEFHPDPVYDNTRVATEDCINYILEKSPMEWTHHFRKENLRLNQHYPLETDQFRDLVNRFKLAYDNLEIKEIADPSCVVNEKDSWVSGTYLVQATVTREIISLTGKWKVICEKDKEFGYWYITEVHMEGISF